MADNVNLSINGQSQVPPGFRFHPTEEELLHYYLRKKVTYEKIDLDVIREVDLNKLEPWDIQEKCRIGSNPQNDCYFFSHKDKKYPTGTRTNRATAAGFWKATGRDKIIFSGFKRIGLRKTLVFYKGRAPHGHKSDWIMHEYRVDDSTNTRDIGSDLLTGDSLSSSEDGWVVCRLFKKKNYQKIIDSPKVGLSASVHSDAQMLCSSNNGVLDQIILYMGQSSDTNYTCKSENQTCKSNNIDAGNDTGEALIHERFMHLPRLEAPNFQKPIDEVLAETGSSSIDLLSKSSKNTNSWGQDVKTRTQNWVSLDRLVAWQLNNAQVDQTTDHKLPSRFINSNHLSFEEDDDMVQSWSLQWHNNTENQAVSDIYNCEDVETWSSLKESSWCPSSSDPLRHLSV